MLFRKIIVICFMILILICTIFLKFDKPKNTQISENIENIDDNSLYENILSENTKKNSREIFITDNYHKIGGINEKTANEKSINENNHGKKHKIRFSNIKQVRLFNKTEHFDTTAKLEVPQKNTDETQKNND